MKSLEYIRYVLLSALVISTLLFTITSCEDDDGVHIEEPDGAPEITYIRVTDPDAADSLIVRANLGQGIVIVGKNLGGTREVWFNDRQAVVTPSWVTNKTVLVSVPNVAPFEITNKIYLVDADGDTLVHDFEVTIPDPEVLNARNEWPQVELGEKLVINGNYFFDVDGAVPVVVSFTGGVESEAVVISASQLEVEVPEGATEGPVTVTTNFGSTASTFHLWDSRNVILDFDTEDTRGNGWRIGTVENGDGPIDENYLVVRGDIAANQRDEGAGSPAESPFMVEFWGQASNRPEGNFYPLYPNSYKDYVLKFETKVNTWRGGYLNIVLAPWSQSNNSDVWNDPFVNARAVWGPWCAQRNDDGTCGDGEEFTTNDQWITVVIPLTDFQYDMGIGGSNVVYRPDQVFVEEAAGSLSTWFLGSPENDGNFVEFFIDNMRIVQP